MNLPDRLKDAKERYLHAYRTTRDVLEKIGIGDPTTNSFFYHKMNLTRSMELDRINNPLEQIAMNLAWHIQRIKHPIRMYRWLRESEDE